MPYKVDRNIVLEKLQMEFNKYFNLFTLERSILMVVILKLVENNLRSKYAFQLLYNRESYIIIMCKVQGNLPRLCQGSAKTGACGVVTCSLDNFCAPITDYVLFEINIIYSDRQPDTEYKNDIVSRRGKTLLFLIFSELFS